ncbi:carboxypeptidase-like regulatory domain-containing protein [Actinotalea solisilvae]|uniref:carboxypeptidase-like regulatory domain-containing protein n=1 Tax=Actinotalea solisilvae TaxID=2072922 RepID=UPI0018F1B1F6|nr:carboxypeptidase-like regulatory domain-containing protein [Actinotalea solisilvae]
MNGWRGTRTWIGRGAQGLAALAVVAALGLVTPGAAVGAAAGGVAGVPTAAADDPAPDPTLDAAPGQIAGRVLVGLEPLAGATVTVLDATTGAPVATSTTAVSGDWSLAVAPGSYQARATPPYPYAETFAPGRPTLATADVYTVASGGYSVVPDMVVERRGVTTAAIQGQVLGYLDLLLGATVTVLDATTGAELASVTLDESQYEYRIAGLAPGEVKVRASKPTWFDGYANERATFETADVLTLVAGQTLVEQWDPPVLVLDLTPGAHLQGHVVADGAGVAGATVEVVSADRSTVLASTVSDATGSFAIDGLAAGPARVRATAPGRPEAWAPGDDRAEPGIYTLQHGIVTSGVVIDLSAEAALTGVVRGFSRAPGAELDGPLAGARVTAFDATSGSPLGSVLTDAEGGYRFESLLADAVTLRATKDGFLTRFALDAPSAATADAVPLGPGPVVAPTLTLPAEAVVEGSVLAGFDPVGGATVAVLDATTGRVLRSVRLGSDQDTYRIGGLPAGEVTVRATKAGWLPSWANGRHTVAEADVLTLVPGQTLRQSWDPLVLYLDLGAGATLSGTVLGDGRALAGAMVAVLDATTHRILTSTTTSATGAYTTPVLRITTGSDPMPVHVRVSKGGWATELAPGPDPARRDVVDLTYADTVAVPTVDLAREGVVSGTVHGLDGDGENPLPGALVTAFSATSGLRVRSAVTGADGGYRLERLPADDYVVRFTAADFTTVWSEGRTSRATADVVAVGAGTTHVLATPVLERWGVLSGFVREAAEGVPPWGRPVAGVQVTVLDAVTCRRVATAVTGPSSDPRSWGLFSVRVPPGTYLLRASAPGWVTRWAVDAPTPASASRFQVVPGSSVAIAGAWPLHRSTPSVS